MNILQEMKVESVREENSRVIVTTTGAKYVIDKSGKNGRISCYQRINGERLMATLDFNCSFSDFTIERKDDSTCMLFKRGATQKGLKLHFNRDSVLEILECGVPGKALVLTFSGDFLPCYTVEKDGNILLIDEKGGVGFYPCIGHKSIEWRNLTEKNWVVNYIFDTYEYGQFLFSIFPPRKFNHEQSIEEKVAHFGGIGEGAPEYRAYPTDDEIEEASKYTNILVLHCEIWQGRLTRAGKPVLTWEDILADESWAGFNGHVPVDEEKLIRVINKARSCGMKVIPYLNPNSSIWQGQDFLHILENKILGKYGMDGVYYDGLIYSEDCCSTRAVSDSYQLIRDTRNILRDKILYVHYTVALRSRYIFYPFIDTYADYTLKSENFFGFDDKYLRYVISGHNTSNSIGYICHSTYPLDFFKTLVDKVLSVNGRFYLGLPETEKEKLLKEKYYPRLKKVS